MRLMVLGTGAIGSVTGGYLSQTGTPVVMVDGWYQHVEAMKARGLDVVNPDGDFHIAVEAHHLDELPELDGPFDVIFLGFKAYDTLWAAQVADHYLMPDGVVVSTQNGINEEVIASVVGRERTVGCVVHMSAGLYEAGRVTRTSNPAWATFTLGELDGAATPRIERLAEVMAGVGETHVSDNIWGELWAKLTLNAMGNALAGLTGYTTRQLWSDPLGVELMIHVGGESVMVCEALGHRMDPLRPAGAPEAIHPERLRAAHLGDRGAWDEVFAQFAGTAAARTGARENKASLLQDMLKGRRTEVEHLNGYIARRARHLGLDAVYNARLPGLIRAVEQGELEMRADNLNRVRPPD